MAEFMALYNWLGDCDNFLLCIRYNKPRSIKGFGCWSVLCTIVPITGFANSVVSPAMEFQTEGKILGTAANMFKIAGTVIVYGTAAAFVYGVIYWITTLF